MPKDKNYKQVNLTSSNLSARELSELHRILPEAFSENKIDWEKLRAVLGNEIDERIEKFNFTWAGKSNAVKNVLIPSRATLRPAKDESVKFDTSENLFIEGNNLEVLKLLQKAYFESVKMIYIDPPYNTGGDFVYHDDFAAPLKNYLQQTGQVDAEGNKLQTNREASGRYHSDWLSMMYPRLKLAWNLLRSDGVIFVSIDDNEFHHLRMIMNEIFGEENFLGVLVWKKRHGHGKQTTSTNLSIQHEYVVAYKKEELFVFQGEPRKRESFTNPDNDPRGDWAKYPMDVGSTKDERPNCFYDLTDPATGNVYHANPNRVWAFHKPTMQQLVEDGRIVFDPTGKNRPYLKRFWNELPSDKKQLSSWIANVNEVIEHDEQVATLSSDYNTVATKFLNELFEGKLFDYPKPVSLIKNLVEQSGLKSGDIVVDFFAGSGTTAQAVYEYNASKATTVNFILVQLPELIDENTEAYRRGFKTITTIAKERMRRVSKGERVDNLHAADDGFKVFELAESNYPENQFEFDPEKSEGENKKAFENYLSQAKHTKLFDDTKAIDMVYENIVKEGFSLNSKIAERKIGKNNTYFVADGERQLLVCLDKKIDEKTISELTGKDYKGKTFICLDNALDDTAKANLGLHVELKTI